MHVLLLRRGRAKDVVAVLAGALNFWLAHAAGNAGLCGEIPSGLQVYRAAPDSQAPQTLFSLDKCPPWINSTAAADAGLAAAGPGAHTGAIVGGVVGGCALLGLVAAAAVVAVMMRRKRQNRRGGHHTVPYRHSSMDGKVRPKHLTAFPLLFLLCIQQSISPRGSPKSCYGSCSISVMASPAAHAPGSSPEVQCCMLRS